MDTVEIRQVALNVALDVTAASFAAGVVDRDAGEYTLANADRFAKWLETGQLPDAEDPSDSN